MSCCDPRGNFSNVCSPGEAQDKELGNYDDVLQFMSDQLEAQLTSSEYAILMHLQSPHQAGSFQFETPPTHPILNPGSMDVQHLQLSQQPGAVNNVNPSLSTQMNSFPLAEPGTSRSSKITNADAGKKEKIKQSKMNYARKKEAKRRENEEKVVEFAKQINDLREVNASLEKEVDKAKIKQKNDEQELSYFKEEVSRLNNKLKGQTMQVDVLSEKLGAGPKATNDAEENKQLKRKIELLTKVTNNPNIIKIVELLEENEKLTNENKKLRIVNDALCDNLSKDKQ